ncbi:MAG: hypothetical protein NTX00_04755 [Candidatus Parcubacteria bacterium]|nr:hypothetical protein [Candidatus Parcubacteria bacterium]
MKKYSFLINIGIIIIVIAVTLLYFHFLPIEKIPPVIINLNSQQISSFDECVASGNPVLETYPAQCKTSSGQTFTQNIGNELEKADLIKVDVPRPNQIISSPLNINGQARGTWFFEASFPIKLYDANNNLITSTTAAAKANWMTTDFVPFEAKLEFTQPTTITGTLIFEKDNPSGLAEKADELTMPIKFSEQVGQLETCKNLCGDGVCQEIVCLAIGCPCSETPDSCPQDCIK